MWDVITYPCLRYLLLAPKCSYLFYKRLYQEPLNTTLYTHIFNDMDYIKVYCFNKICRSPRAINSVNSALASAMYRCWWNHWGRVVHDTVQCRYNAVNFLPNPHYIHPIARPLGRDMGCNLWFDTDLYSAPVKAVLYEILCHIWPCYNGIQLCTYQ